MDKLVIPYLCCDKKWYVFDDIFNRIPNYEIKHLPNLSKFLDDIKANHNYRAVMIDVNVDRGNFRDQFTDELPARKIDQKAEMGIKAIVETKKILNKPIIYTSTKLHEDYNERANILGVAKILKMGTADFYPEMIAKAIEEVIGI